jgi:hypothetical protein
MLAIAPDLFADVQGSTDIEGRLPPCADAGLKTDPIAVLEHRRDDRDDIPTDMPNVPAWGRRRRGRR